MAIKMLFTGAVLAISFMVATHFVVGIDQLEIFALFLALTSFVYGGAILTPAGAKYTYVEMPVVILVFVSSVLGLLLSPLWLSAGYVLHGVWDIMHHFKKVNTPVVKWLPPMCAAFDFFMAAFIVWLWLQIWR